MNLFKQMGLIKERRLGKLRCYHEIKHSAEYQHMICQECGKVLEFETPLLHELFDTIQTEHDFKVTKVEL